MNICKTTIVAVPETAAKITVSITLVKTENGKRFSVKAEGLKVPFHRPYMTASREDATKAYNRIMQWANAIAWRENNPNAVYDQIPTEHIQGRKGFGGDYWTFPVNHGEIYIDSYSI